MTFCFFDLGNFSPELFCLLNELLFYFKKAVYPTGVLLFLP